MKKNKTKLNNETQLINTEPATKAKKIKTLTAEQVEKTKILAKRPNPKRTLTGKKIKPLKGEARAKVDRFRPTIKSGLNDTQIDLRQQQGLINNTTVKTTKSYASIIFGNIFTFFNLLCFAVVAALIAVGQWKNLSFFVIILANLLIGIIQEIKAKITVEKITLVTAPLAEVVRNGETGLIPTTEVVLDDIINLDLGKQICADCIVLDGNVSVNESLITGESESVKKKIGDTLYAGSYITAGSCVARVEKVSVDCYSSKLAQKAKTFKAPKSDLVKALKAIIASVGIIIIPLAYFTFKNNWNATGQDLVATINGTAASVIGMIPAGMFLLTSVALAVGVVKLAKKRTLVQDLYGIEMLARADVLCLDKTGTITDGSMTVKLVKALDGKSDTYVNEVMGSMLSAFGGNNQTSRALLNYFTPNTIYSPETVLEFDSTRKTSAVTFNNKMTYIMGAPEMVTKKIDKELQKELYSYLQRGYRVLLVAESKGSIEKDKTPKEVTPIAYIVIEDNIRKDAEETIKWFNDNGVEIKIISGDNPVTVSEISKRVGVIGADKYISMEGINNEDIPAIINKYTVFGRVSPDQKKWLVRALRKKGKKVAMTGDGVNDILALKEADCSIAMASGSEAARNVANIVMLDSNFSSMPNVIAEGRRVVNNISKSSALFLMKTFFTIFLTIFCLIIRKDYLISNTNQTLLLESLVIGIPSFFLALQPNNTPIRGTFMAKLVLTALPAALTLFINVMLVYVLGLFIDINAEISTMCSLALTLTGFIILFRICRPLDNYKIILLSCMAVAFIGIVSFIPDSFFGYEPMQLHSIFYLVILTLISYHLYSSMIALCNHLYYNKDEIVRKIKGIGSEKMDDDDLDYQKPELTKDELAKKEARKQNLFE